MIKSEKFNAINYKRFVGIHNQFKTMEYCTSSFFNKNKNALESVGEEQNSPRKTRKGRMNLGKLEENLKSETDENNPSQKLGNFLQQFTSSTQKNRSSKRAHPLEEVPEEGKAGAKKTGRFNGLTEKEVSRKTIPDHLKENLDIIIIGINPGLASAHAGHHYAGTGNHFWKCLHLSGLTEKQFQPQNGYKLLEKRIGLTNMVEKATKGSNDLSKKDLQEGAAKLREKLGKFKPKIAVFNGKVIYEVFSGRKDFDYGKQPDTIEGIHVWVMPSSSPRCSLLPRAEDKVPFYVGLRKFRDYLNGEIETIDESEVVFKIGKSKVSSKKKLVNVGMQLKNSII